MASAAEWRSAELRGAAAARILQDKLGLRSQLKYGNEPVDVFKAIDDEKITCMFQPLNSILGAFVTYENVSGIILTTLRSQHVQRFTAAHELGHATLAHDATSLDEEVGFAARGPVPSDGKGLVPSKEIREIEADSFASEFLLPKWLIVAHARRRNWSAQSLTEPEIVYQLSLRLGTSYSATCWALSSNNLVSRGIAERLVRVPPKASKQRVLGDFEPESWRNTNVWFVTLADKGARFVGSPDDRLVFSLPEHAASGFRWELTGNNKEDLLVERDESSQAVGEDAQMVGVANQRHLQIAAGTSPVLTLEEKRGWSKESPPIETLSLELDMLGAEEAGLPRVTKKSIS